MKRVAGVIGVEGLALEFGFLGLGQHDDGPDAVEMGSRLFPQECRHLAGHIAAKAIHAHIAHPVFEHLDHGFAHFGLGIIELDDVFSIRNGRHELAAWLVGPSDAYRPLDLVA